MADYSPPKGYAAGLNFKGTYTAPRGYAVGLHFGTGEDPGGETLFIAPPGLTPVGIGSPFVAQGTRSITPPGINQSGIGQPTVWNLDHVARPAGYVATLWGRPTVLNGTPQVFPTGILATAFGTSKVYNLLQPIRPVGLAAFQGFGSTWVSLGTRRITAGVGDQARYGTAALAGGVRWLDLAGRGFVATAMGSPVTWFRVREVLPQWFVATRYGLPLLDFNHDVAPLAFGGEAFGQAEVHVPRITVDLAGRGIAGAIGDHVVWNYKQHVRPVGWRDGGPNEVDRFGRPEAYNLRQYVAQLFDVTPSDGGVFGTFNRVDLRNKVVRAEGFDAARHSLQASLRNNARLVRTPPLQEHTRWGSTLVAPRVRELRPVGYVATQWGSVLGTIVHNGARVLAPTGWLASAFGQPGPVWSNLQTIKAIGTDTSQFGAGMVAFRIRTVAVFPLPPPPPFGNVHTQHGRRFLAPPSIDPRGFGNASLIEKFTIIAPAAILAPANAFGTGRVWNLTPELRTHGAVHTEWGTPRVFNQFERYAFQGFVGTVFGTPVVKDRRLFVVPGSIAPLAISQKHQVNKVLPDPPATRTLGAVGYFDETLVGRPAIRTNVLYAAGSAFAVYGQPTVVSMGIAPKGITPPLDAGGTQFGRAQLNVTQFVSPAGMQPPVPPIFDVGPRYVWAPRGYPYSTGLWTEIGRTMDFDLHGHDQRPVFGHVTITHRHRPFFPSGRDSSVFGMPRLALRQQYVQHEGTRYQRFGFPALNKGGTAETVGFDMALYGTAIVIIPDYGDKTAKPGGIAGGAFGATRVELFHRQLLAKGWDSFTISPPHAPSWPRQSHWVSREYPPFPALGFETARYGTPWVSHYVRTLEPVGFDQSIVAEHTPGSFDARMRVRKRDGIANAGGSELASYGRPTVGLGTRYLAPRTMIEGRIGRPGVLGRNAVVPATWADAVFGDVDRWEAGKVKPHGDDLAALGRAVLHRALRPLGPAGEVGEPRIAQPLAASAIAGGGVGAPTFVARVCGNKAMAAHGAALGAVGAPTITTA